MYLLFLSAWKRPEITEICFMGIRRLKKEFPINTLCVISEESMVPLCRKYDINFCFYKNEPLGEKKNFGLTQAMTKKWDYMVELGSDDLIKREAFNFYDDSPMQGLDKIGFINSETGDVNVYETKSCFGLGRKIRRDVIENYCKGVEIEALDTLISPGRNVHKGRKGFFPIEDAKKMQDVKQCVITSTEKYKLWKDDANRAMDNQSAYFLNIFGVKEKKTHTEEPLLIDIKSQTNIWGFNPTLGTPYNLEKLLEGLSDDEQVSILNLIRKNQCIETQVIR